MGFMKFDRVNNDYPITLMADKPTTQDGQWGVKHIYPISFAGGLWDISASDGLHKQLSLYGKGSNLTVRKETFGDAGHSKFVVTSNGVTPPSAMAATPVMPMVGIDDRTKDIHRQVCLKLACQMFGESQVTLSAGSITVIEANMLQLLQVLDGDDAKDEAPKESVPEKDSDLPF